MSWESFWSDLLVRDVLLTTKAKDVVVYYFIAVGLHKPIVSNLKALGLVKAWVNYKRQLAYYTSWIWTETMTLYTSDHGNFIDSVLQLAILIRYIASLACPCTCPMKTEFPIWLGCAFCKLKSTEELPRYANLNCFLAFAMRRLQVYWFWNHQGRVSLISGKAAVDVDALQTEHMQ